MTDNSLRMRSGDMTVVRLGLWALITTVAIGNALAQAPRRFEFRLSAEHLVHGARTIRVVKGETVELQWASDRAVELHLHGYDLNIRVTPELPQTMRFHAHATGRFPLELHGSSARHRPLIYVEVHPR